MIWLCCVAYGHVPMCFVCVSLLVLCQLRVVSHTFGHASQPLFYLSSRPVSTPFFPSSLPSLFFFSSIFPATRPYTAQGVCVHPERSAKVPYNTFTLVFGEGFQNPCHHASFLPIFPTLTLAVAALPFWPPSSTFSPSLYLLSPPLLLFFLLPLLSAQKLYGVEHAQLGRGACLTGQLGLLSICSVAWLYIVLFSFCKTQLVAFY